MFEQAFKNIDDVLRKEAGCTTELDYTEQTSWLLFLKYLDGLEQDRAMEAELEGKKYAFILDEPYRWESWAAPKGKDGTLDHNKALTADDLRDFVVQKLFPYLHGFTQKASGPNTIEYKIGQIFGEIRNKISSGYNLREVIDHIDELRFRSQTEKHELSALYEEKIKRMGNAGRNGGEYYTPRPLIRAIVQVTRPKIGERIYDAACGSAGFLCESFDYLKSGGNLTTRDLSTLQTRTFYGKEKKSLAYVIAIMNMILHGIEAPNIIHTNSLTENLADVQEKDRYDVVLANPPFGGKERREVQQNFPIRTGETAFLFLQHFIRMLKAGGRGGIVIKNTFLSNTDNASISLRKLLLESCNLHTVLDCPGGTFQGAGVKTVVLFFEKGAPTRNIWFYQLDPGRNLGKTNPLNDDDLAEFVTLQKTFTGSPKSWCVDASSIDKTTSDLSVKNPNNSNDTAHRSPHDILVEIAARRRKREGAGEYQGAAVKNGWQTNRLGEVCSFLNRGISPSYLEAGGICVLNQKCIRDHRVAFEPSRRHDAITKKVGDDRLVRVGDVLVNSTGTGTLGRVAQLRRSPAEPTTVDSHVTIVRPKPGKFCPDFFGYMLVVIEDAIKEAGEGCGGQTELARSVLAEKFLVRYPESIPEQRRIVGILDEAFAGITSAKANAEKNLRNARALFQAHLQSVLTQPGPGWVEKPFSELCTIKHGYAFEGEFFSNEGEYVLLTPGNFYETGGYRDRGEKQKYYTGEILRDYVLDEGDLLVAMTEQAAGLLGSAVLVPESDRFLHNQRLGLVIKKPGTAWTNEFFFHVFNTQAVRKAIHASASGVKVRHTSPTKIGEVIVAFPTSLREQTRIVSILASFTTETQRLESLYQRKLTALDALKESLLHQAFIGQL